MTLEHQQSLERAIDLATGATAVAVRVKYRRPPTRRWSSLLLFVDDPSRPVPDDVVELAIAAHEQRKRP